MTQRPLAIDRAQTRRLHLPYLLHLPAEYGAEPHTRWPLILFLHGAGERGDDLERVKKYGIARVVEDQPDFPFITVSPQCPLGTTWLFQLDALDALLEETMATYAVDPERVYLTGLSMGGNGTWHYAAAHPERFAAIAAVCGWGEWWAGFPDHARVLKNLPVWAFHGARDDVVPLAGSTSLVDVLEAAGGDVRLTVYPEAMHDSWTETYANPELYRWFLKHRRAAGT